MIKDRHFMIDKLLEVIVLAPIYVIIAHKLLILLPFISY